MTNAIGNNVCPICWSGIPSDRITEEAGFSIYDDVVHGFGGGHWPRVLGRNSRSAGGIPDLRLEANMTLVVQPNVITQDETAGVQLGAMARVMESGFERMHAAPWGLLRIDP
jgi:Xaa-Pro dipeptidase